jgi:circadian clock protein KaiA
MSDHHNQIRSAREFTNGKLRICLFSTQKPLSRLITKLLRSDRYELKDFDSNSEFINFVSQNCDRIDCAILMKNSAISSILKSFWELEIWLPTIILEIEKLPEITIAEVDNLEDLLESLASKFTYHQGEICLYLTQLTEIAFYINLAITKFINLAPDSNSTNNLCPTPQIQQSGDLVTQQHRLTKKMRESLGDLRSCYERNPNIFYSNLSETKQKKLVRKLSSNYRQILLDYFDDNGQINKLIGEFVDRAFFNNISTSQILEIHMELIDDFAQQLKIEGRGDDILLDYRLPLIDVMAHLCEVYRRSIPLKNYPLELLFAAE